MDMARATLALQYGKTIRRVAATRVRFSPHQCVVFDDGPVDLACLDLLARHLARQPGLAVAIEGEGRLLRYLLRHAPILRPLIRCVIVEAVPADGAMMIHGIPVSLGREIP